MDALYGARESAGTGSVRKRNLWYRPFQPLAVPRRIQHIYATVVISTSGATLGLLTGWVLSR